MTMEIMAVGLSMRPSFSKYIAVLFTSLMLVSCGGGGGGSAPAGGTPSVTLALMVDSIGRQIPEGDFGGGDSGAAGADGTAGDGAPIANAPVVLTDNAGHTVTATTDALGYYRINVKGFTPPFVVKVTRSDGTVWYSHSTTPVQTRGFVTMNLTGLTDKVGNYIAEAANIAGGAASVTPAVLASNPAALQLSKTKVSTALTSPLTYVGLNPATFDPVATSYQATKTDNYDKLLERLKIFKEQGTGVSVVVGTLAGVQESLLDGVGQNATFSEVGGVAKDSTGNVYVADSGNNAIRKISPTGVVSTLAGNGSRGLINGIGNAATFNYPMGVAVDSTGIIYVADTGNHVIRKISTSGVVSTFAGSGSIGFINGTGSNASFNTPSGLAVDRSGAVFVADKYNHAIRKITPSGVVSTFAGTGVDGFANGIGTAASFFYPSGVAVDIAGNVFVADSSNNAIRKISPLAAVSTFARVASTGLTVDNSGNVFVADYWGQSVYQITSAGVVNTFAGSGSPDFIDGTGTAASFFFPSGVVVDSSGDVFVADLANHAIRKISSTANVTTVAGRRDFGFVNGVGTTVRFDYPRGVAADGSGNVYVADFRNNVIRKISATGVVTTFAGSGLTGFDNGPGSTASFNYPSGVAVDSTGNVYVADRLNHAIRKISSTGVVSTLAGSGSRGFINGSGTAASFALPIGVALDGFGNIYVADADNSAIRKITLSGVVSTVAGNGSPGFTNGTGISATFAWPNAVALDASGNIFVSDSDNNVIRKITSSGVVSTFAGTGSFGFNNGTGTTASFQKPSGVAFDNKGNLFVADTGNNAIRKISQLGVVTTLSGDGTSGYLNGAGSTARFNGPYGVAVDNNGIVYVSDAINNAIRIILP